MRVQCDVCCREPAAVLCCADEAALCAACDRRVHSANKLAGKHRRFSLLSPDGGSSTAPLCDVCQERRGLVFCVEDRAILCKDCDDPIHGANELTAKHSRFLLVGVRLSAAPLTVASPSSDDSEEAEEIAGDAGSHQDEETSATATATATATDNSTVLDGSNGGVNGGSSITEYLTKVCPGWRVEDLLIDDAAAAAAAQKEQEELVPFLDPELFGLTAAPVQPEQHMWVPHVPQARTAAPVWVDVGLDAVPAMAVPTAKAAHGHGMERWTDNDAFTVPQISPPANPDKRARPSFWYY